MQHSPEAVNVPDLRRSFLDLRSVASRILLPGTDDLRCHHPVASSRTMMQPDLLRPATE
jgi:hypothetical protein